MPRKRAPFWRRRMGGGVGVRCIAEMEAARIVLRCMLLWEGGAAGVMHRDQLLDGPSSAKLLLADRLCLRLARHPPRRGHGCCVVAGLRGRVNLKRAADQIDLVDAELLLQSVSAHVGRWHFDGLPAIRAGLIALCYDGTDAHAAELEELVGLSCLSRLPIHVLLDRRPVAFTGLLLLKLRRHPPTGHTHIRSEPRVCRIEEGLLAVPVMKMIACGMPW
mmetsp:Transcript_57536/g.114192  ORF Transcript_57536/g.114192 Transcript_57536/m.114192 type:complete len:219 (+) Transcript_57536:350-1006(+)